jgi:hypothetical protein
VLFLSRFNRAAVKKSHASENRYNDKGDGGLVWLKPITDEEYNAGGQ